LLQRQEKYIQTLAKSVLSNSAVVDMEIPPLKEGKIRAKTLYTEIVGKNNSATIVKPNLGIEYSVPEVLGHEFSAEVLEWDQESWRPSR